MNANESVVGVGWVLFWAPFAANLPVDAWNSGSHRTYARLFLQNGDVRHRMLHLRRKTDFF